MNEKEKVHPFEYFGFDENGKTWWFEFATLFTWVLRSETPVNPYTKVLLSTDTRKRLFRMWVYRIKHRQSPVLAMTLHEGPGHCANYLAQLFADNGFADVHAQSFLELSKPTWARFFRVLQNELMVAYSETNIIRRRGIILCRRMEHFAPVTTPQQFITTSLQTLLRLMTVPRDPYLVCFMVLSCFYRC